ncbi:MAG TPA: 5-methyltetrahydropteroyltriglutamate--homocysteine S-methyltransferase [Alphaproteobacteria bacterium]|nr:5-methyltetrahydropteroyltriglutamate--homocysteine S-methyltransferase [Alphaproteobacteria bacterium]
MARNGKPIFRADHVGSLLRPDRLHGARSKFDRGEITRDELRAVEDECIVEAAKLQEDVGLQVITDGEFRRSVWWYEFIDALNGIEIAEPDKGAAFSGGSEEWEYLPKTVRTVGKIGRLGEIMVPEFEVLRAATSQTPKITIPSPSRIHFHGGRAAVDTAVYPDMEAFWSDIAAVYQQEIASLEAAGCTYIQIDDPVLTYFLDDRLRGNVKEIGEDPDALLPKYVEVINRCIAKRKPETQIGIHLCRGNSRSKWIAAGPYEPIAEAIFPQLNVDTYLLEYDDERSGGFEPLRFVPDDKIVVLGLVTTKTGQMEEMDTLRRRVDEAAKFQPAASLAISPQCGFASEVGGNIVTLQDELNKLRLVVQAADEIWGNA